MLLTTSVYSSTYTKLVMLMGTKLIIMVASSSDPTPNRRKGSWFLQAQHSYSHVSQSELDFRCMCCAKSDVLF